MGEDNQRPQPAMDDSIVWLTVYKGAVREGRPLLANQARRELAKVGVLILGEGPMPKEATPCK